MLLFVDETYDKRFDWVESVIQAEAAWTVDGARQLAEMLRDDLGDLRASIEQRFGFIGD